VEQITTAETCNLTGQIYTDEPWSQAEK